MQRRSNQRFKALYFVQQGANGKYSNKHFLRRKEKKHGPSYARIKGLSKLVSISHNPSDDSVISNSCWKIF